MSKWKSSKTHHFWRFQPKRTSPSFSAHFFTYYSTGQIWFATFVRLWHCFDIRIINNYIFLMFWRLRTMLERFFEAKSFRLHISKTKHVPGNTCPLRRSPLCDEDFSIPGAAVKKIPKISTSVTLTKKSQNENHQKLIIFEGFSQNGYHHLFQRIFLRIIALANINFRHFFGYDIFWH